MTGPDLVILILLLAVMGLLAVSEHVNRRTPEPPFWDEADRPDLFNDQESR